MSKVNYNDIDNIQEPWEGYAGSSVEKFIKNTFEGKCGYIWRSSQKEGDYYYLYGFTGRDQYEEWASGTPGIVPLFKVQLPNIENDVYSVNLTTNSNTQKLVNLGNGVKVGLKYTSISQNPVSGEISDTFNDGTLIIQRSANGSAFTEVARLPIQPVAHDSQTFTEVDVTAYLEDGDNRLRIRVEDNVNGAQSANITFNSIINTTLKVTSATPTNLPLNALQLQYYIQGQVAKTLHIRITQGSADRTFDFPLGLSTYVEVPYTTPVMEMDLDSGIINTDAWLTVDDTVLASEHDINQYYYSEGGEQQTVIILNDVNNDVVNYTNAHLFDMTLYNQGADVTVSVKSMDGQTEYVNLEFNNCQTNTLYPVYATLEVETPADSFSAIVYVTSADFNCEPYTITVDNSEKMSPTDGADFILNPKQRSNTEANPARIINSATSQSVASTFNGFAFINDGWVNDQDNIKVLRIPANHTLSISYDCLDNLVSGTTVEVDFKTYNVFNDNDTVFSFSSLTGDDKPLGFIMNPTEASFYTAENQTKRDQDVIFQEETRTHLALNILPNLGNTGLNYIRIFINGVMNREILYNTNDVFKNGVLTMNFGSQNCDIDIYGIRVYKKGLSASDVRQDYMSTIPTLEGKIAYKTANNILSANGTISYDKAKVMYNTLVWTGSVPSYSTGNRSYRGKLGVNIVGDTEHSGEITNLQIKGQGSSSRSYWKWNHQYDMNKYDEPSVFTNLDGSTYSGYALTDEDPEAKKLVAKLNWASSMQSHKMGGTALYNDLWKAIVGGNGITKTQGYDKVRNAVHEKPFLYFVRENENETPVFYGLMTFGSAKYDKPTFVGSTSAFPEYLIIEGSDNGMPLTLRQVPWFDDEVTYNSEEEYYEYAGQGNWDYGLGNQDNISYFKNASNFVYLHSPFLMPMPNDPSEMEAKYQYWDSDRNVKRYDYISQDWVDAGTTKTNGEYDVLNLETQTGLLRSNYASDASYNDAVISWRVNDFRTRVDNYYNVNDVIFSMVILKLIGASDNRCKNTYEYIDPVSMKICMAQDDVDTLMLTDNVGRKTKPYYVEEYDLDPDNKPYFNGSDNVFFRLMDLAYPAEEKNMMKTVFNYMRENFDSPEGCIQDYFFSTQMYFPAVAYNETARLLYEEAAVAYANGEYDNATPPITQSLGDQLQGERQWWRRRIPYLESWASADPFYTRSTVEPNVMFRSMTTVGGTNPTYRFSLTPWQWLYPKVGTGQYLSSDDTRVQALQPYTTVTMATDGNTDTYIYGSDYYTSLGEFGGVSLSESFRLNGKRLLEFSADSRDVSTYEFRPTSMTVNCPALKSLTLYGCSTLAGSLDLSGSVKLNDVDLRGTSLNSVTFPESEKLTTVYVNNLTNLYLVNCPNLSTINATSWSNLISITTDNNTVAEAAVRSQNSLAEIHFIGIDLDFSTYAATASDKLYSLLVAQDSTATGEITLNKTLTQAEKNALTAKYGNIDSAQNDLHVIYTVSDASTFSIEGSDTLPQGRTKTYTIDYAGNNASSYSWTVTNAESYHVSGDGLTCNVTASTSSLADITVSVNLTKINGDILQQSKTLTVVEDILLTGFSIGDVTINSQSDTSTYVPFVFTPANFTCDYQIDEVTLTINDYVELGGYTNTNLTLVKIADNNTANVAQARLHASLTADGGSINLTADASVYITNPIQTFLISDTSLGNSIVMRDRISIGFVGYTDDLSVKVYTDPSVNHYGFSGVTDSSSNPYAALGSELLEMPDASTVYWLPFTDDTYPSYIPDIAVRVPDSSITASVYVSDGLNNDTVSVEVPAAYSATAGHYACLVFRISDLHTIALDTDLSYIV